MKTDILVIGGGPAGMNAAIEAAKAGVNVTLLDRHSKLGGQLLKQTHKFFGWAEKGAGTRGIQLAEEWEAEVYKYKNIRVMLNTEALGLYDDQSWLVEQKNKLIPIYPKKVIIAVGAQEKTLLIENGDIPGIYGAGAIQTMMHLYGVLPGEKYLIVGAGNIGVILAYQLVQAGAEVKAVVDILPKLRGAYWVHVTKIRRMGIPLYMKHSVVKIKGDKYVEGATIAEFDDNFKPIPGTEKNLDIDTIAISIGLSPLIDLMYQANVELIWIPELGGLVPVHSENMRTTNKDIYVAGDASGIEEATTAALEGKIAGAIAAYDLGYKVNIQEIDEWKKQLSELREAPLLEHLRNGLHRLHQAAKERGVQ